MKISRRFTKAGQDVYSTVEWDKRVSRITNPDGSVVFEMKDAMIPKAWSQLATDIMVSKYFRKAGVPQTDSDGNPVRDENGNIVTGPEKSARQVINRLAGCWRHWGESHGYFDTKEDAQAFYDELSYMLLHQMCAPNSPQWFNTGLNWAYGITGPAQGHFFCDPKSGDLLKSKDAYSHPQPHACFIQSVSDDLVNPGGIMDLWTREARLFKYGSGTGSNFSRLRGENEALSGGGKSSGLMSFLKIGDRAAGAIKSGGTTRRAAKMVCLDLDHPDVESFVNWKVREELKVAALAEGIKVLPKDQQELAKRLGLKLDYDFNGEAYFTVSGQNSNNSVRIPNEFFKALETDGDWNLVSRVNGKPTKTLKARELWDQIAFAAWRCADPGVQYDDTINQWHTCPASGRINASNPCVTGDTRVLSPGGIWRRIDQMIHIPTRVITNQSEQEVHTTDGAFPTGTKDVFELQTECGYSVKLTADHKVWTRSRGWVEAAQLTTSDELRLPAQPACVEQVGEPQDARFFQLAGLLMSCANGQLDTLHLDHCLDAPALNQMQDYAHEYWAEFLNDNEFAIAQADPGQLDLNGSGVAAASDGGVATMTVTNRRLISRIRAFSRVEDNQTRFSDDTFTIGLAAQKHILRGLFSADGHVVNNTIELRHRSLGLLQDVQTVLLGFGVKSRLIGPGASAPAGLATSDELSTILSQPDGGAVDCGGLPERRVSPTLLGTRTPPGNGGHQSRHDADSRRHGLRIDSGSLRLFCKYIAVLPGAKLEELVNTAGSGQWAMGRETSIPADRRLQTADCNWDRVASFTRVGHEQVFDLTEPATSSFVANGLTVHNCSEYMFLDDTACNLASLNVLTFFDGESRRFDVEGYKHGIRLWTVVLEISVLMASFPSEDIAKLSYKFRTLGLGYANLGAMLMQAGIPYDSEKARAICGALTAILTGESYAASAQMSKELGAFPGFAENKTDMLRVMRNHRRAAYDVGSNRAAAAHMTGKLGDYEKLDIHPVGINANQFSAADALAVPTLLSSAQECWDRAVTLGEKYGYRNAQTSVIAPTGTIGLLMDCDTTGVEPDFALVKFKKLAGGGYFKIANQSLPPALKNLGYSPEQVSDIIKHVMGTLTLQDSPHINWATLKLHGFEDAELEKIEQSLPGMFELSFAFSPWSLNAELFKRLNVPEHVWQAPGFNLLRHLGFSKQQIDEASDVICGRGTVEGAPHLREDHLAVFDCANKCGKHGKRFIDVEGHIRMMAAAQPFISGAISKTINLPNEATVQDIEQAYELSWKLGLKANALYRDGSKLSQPLNVKSDEELEKVEEDDDDNVAAAKDELAADVTKAVATVSGIHAAAKYEGGNGADDANIERLEPVHTHIIEKIVERIVERPLRRRLPDTRHAVTHKFDISGHEGYLTVGLYDDGQPGELFITMAKEGSTIGGLMDTIATLVSVSLQYGVPVESLVRKFEHVRFEPSGMTRNSDIPFAKSLVDYIFRWMAMQFVPGYRAANAPEREPAPTLADAVEEELDQSRGEVTRPFEGNEIPSPSSPGDKAGGSAQRTRQSPAAAKVSTSSRLATLDPLSQQGSSMQSDAPACDVCGSITVRSGTCYKCQNCGNSMGCS
ncbi:MAG TPA: LAGLIDADG family homing endonuclease [Tepidisphaeraceae bacterium]|nr:LAGLIDADG family homing endonuclease [Tepidisphaeraceae bacterium]